jgi:hypothetical protein
MGGPNNYTNESDYDTGTNLQDPKILNWVKESWCNLRDANCSVGGMMIKITNESFSGNKAVVMGSYGDGSEVKRYSALHLSQYIKLPDDREYLTFKIKIDSDAHEGGSGFLTFKVFINQPNNSDFTTSYTGTLTWWALEENNMNYRDWKEVKLNYGNYSGINATLTFKLEALVFEKHRTNAPKSLWYIDDIKFTKDPTDAVGDLYPHIIH